MSEYRQRFMSGNDQVLAVRPGIQSSWRRCRQWQVNPEKIIGYDLLPQDERTGN
jgi:transcriptional regulator of acetoin/glycerol metabolism